MASELVYQNKSAKHSFVIQQYVPDPRRYLQVPGRYASGYVSLGWLAGLAWLPSGLKHSFFCQMKK